MEGFNNITTRNIAKTLEIMALAIMGEINRFNFLLFREGSRIDRKKLMYFENSKKQPLVFMIK